MHALFHSLMADATQLTRNGQLQAATEAIQRALRSGGPAPAPHAASRFQDGIVLDGLTRVVNDDNLDPTPPQTQTAATHKSAHPEAHPPAEQWLDGEFTHQGRTLRYKLYVPAASATTPPLPRPLVMMLHGCTQDAADFATGTQMNTLARELGVVVLYPEQTQRANAQKCWNWFKPQHQQRGRGEPAVLAALAQSVAAQHNVDPRKMYVAGLSAGGAMADIVGRCYPDVFAAVGVHSGLPSGAASDVVSALSAMRSGAAHAAAPRADGKVPPTIVFHGDADHTVHIDNGAAIAKAARAAHQRTGNGAATARPQEGRSAAGQRYTRHVDADSTGLIHTEYWQLHGAGHAWSGGSAKGSYTNAGGVDASAEMLRFFLAHALRG
jgi:poly(hydroxyalkanoate) depolymerase family esterase